MDQICSSLRTISYLNIFVDYFFSSVRTVVPHTSRHVVRRENPSLRLQCAALSSPSKTEHGWQEGKIQGSHPLVSWSPPAERLPTLYYPLLAFGVTDAMNSVFWILVSEHFLLRVCRTCHVCLALTRLAFLLGIRSISIRWMREPSRQSDYAHRPSVSPLSREFSIPSFIIQLLRLDIS